MKKEVIEMKRLYFIPLLLYLFFSLLSCTNPPEDIPEEPGEDASLKLVEVSGNILGIDLTNNVPVKGVQFIIEGVKVNEVRITSRTEGFLAEFNEKNGKVILLSLSGNKIDQGTGPIVEIICDEGDSARLSGVKIVK